ncbi:hypothetical protein A3216_00940 [Mycobacterium leprae 7935681]|uniref:hypothetical protein n=1 Tax=Mycobacterium leprae TaxID=1769 RepID=UPI0007DB10BE|nr:hypothetical protein [Mycobacterium leprae]OAX72317.1 hypothetical protein A3216_00940 [Mycobacterium leprae 7935681]
MISPPHNTTAISQTLGTSLRGYVFGFYGLCSGATAADPPTAMRSAGRRTTLRGRIFQNISLKRSDARSSDVATQTWWTRLCSM